MKPNEFDDFCRFRILPAVEFEEQAKIEDMIHSDKVTRDYKEVYENFLAEGKQNIHDYEELLGKPIKYGDKFQLYQRTSRRYFCLRPYSQTILDTYAKDKSIEGSLKALGFSEHPSKMTHFSFEPSADYQKEEDHQIVKCYHDCYLTSEDKLKVYFCALDTCCVFTQNIKSVVKPLLLKNHYGCVENQSHQQINYVMISHGLSNNYLYSNRDEVQKGSSVELRKVEDEDQHDAGFFWKLIWNEANQSYTIWDIFRKHILTVQDGGNKLTCAPDAKGYNEFKFEFDENDFYAPEIIGDDSVFKIVCSQDMKNLSSKGLANDGKGYLKQVEADLIDDTDFFDTDDQAQSNLRVSLFNGIEKDYMFSIKALGHKAKSEVRFIKFIKFYFETAIGLIKEDPKNLQKHAECITILFQKCNLFVKNYLKGYLRRQFARKKILKYRQNMLAYHGILTQIIDLTREICSDGQLEIEWDLSTIPISTKHNLYTEMFSCLTTLIKDNLPLILKTVRHVKDFAVLVSTNDSCVDLIVELLKRDMTELNKNEIHSSILKIQKVYEVNPIYTTLVERLSENVSKTKSEQEIMILRKLCVANANPFVQYQINI